jgi:hypothetical protein
MVAEFDRANDGLDEEPGGGLLARDKEMEEAMGDLMFRRLETALALALLVSMPCRAADIAANARRDAARLANCMKAFDAPCANSMTYTKILEERGISRSQLDQQVGAMYANLKTSHVTYSRFDLGAPWPPFVRLGRRYIFIPYNAVLEGMGRKALAKSFLIGVSEDDGTSWKFVDGQRLTKDMIGQIIPGYVGKLPEQQLGQIE